MASRSAVAVLLTVALALSGCDADPPAERHSVRAAPVAAPSASSVTTVIAVSIDGLNPAALSTLGPEGTPTLHRLIDDGASTLNARTEREQTDTLPNHTGMVTGRWIAAAKGGHGVTWNDDRMRPPTVHEAAGQTVASVFNVVRRAELSTAVFAGKQKFSLFERSWPRAVDRSTILPDNTLLVRALRGTLPTTPEPSGSCTCPHPISPATRMGSCRRSTSTPYA